MHTYGETAFHLVTRIFQYERIEGISARSHYCSVMFGSYNEDHVLKVQTKENVDISKYQVNVTSQALSVCMM